MVKRGSIVLFILVSFLLSLVAQKHLLIEKAGNPRTERINMYDDLTFQLKDDSAGWYTRRILDMDADGQVILLGDSWVLLKDISKIRLKRQRAVANILGGALQVGGISMFMTDAFFSLSGRPDYAEDGMEFGLINFAVGTLIRVTWAPIKHKMSKRKRLRIVDLTF